MIDQARADLKAELTPEMIQQVVEELRSFYMEYGHCANPDHAMYGKPVGQCTARECIVRNIHES